ncbi:13914_t:CDS:2, partial [Acaulospora colombiana]
MSVQNGKKSSKKRKSAEITDDSFDRRKAKEGLKGQSAVKFAKFPTIHKNGVKNSAAVLQSNADVKSQPQEIDLPRGGASSRSSVFRKEKKVDEDDLFDKDSEEQVKIPVKKRSRTSKSKSDIPKVSDTGNPGSSKNKNEKFVEILNFHHLTVGALLFGQIIRINSLDLVVSLPNQMKGIVKISHISDQISNNIAKAAKLEGEDDENLLPDLSKLFHIGQWVHCVVSGLVRRDEAPNNALKHNQHNTIELSLIPKEVNRDLSLSDLSKGFIIAASVESLEDHGYILSIGINGVSGFLHNKDAKSYEDKFNDGRPLSIGQLLNVGVMKIPDKHRVIQFTADPEIVVNSVLPENALRNINTMIPGNLVKTRVDSILKNGILCNVNGIDCEIDIFHSGNALLGNQDVNEGDEIRARVIYVSITNETKKFRLSLSPHVLRLEYLENRDSPIGTIFESVTIKKVITNFGLIMKIEDSNIPGYIHVSRVSDTRVNSLSDFSIDSTHRARVIGYSVVDGLLLLSMQNSVL